MLSPFANPNHAKRGPQSSENVVSRFCSFFFARPLLLQDKRRETFGVVNDVRKETPLFNSDRRRNSRPLRRSFAIREGRRPSVAFREGRLDARNTENTPNNEARQNSKGATFNPTKRKREKEISNASLNATR